MVRLAATSAHSGFGIADRVQRSAINLAISRGDCYICDINARPAVIGD
jgi:hypothetical protein